MNILFSCVKSHFSKSTFLLFRNGCYIRGKLLWIRLDYDDCCHWSCFITFSNNLQLFLCKFFRSLWINRLLYLWTFSFWFLCYLFIFLFLFFILAFIFWNWLKHIKEQIIMLIILCKYRKRRNFHTFYHIKSIFSAINPCNLIINY